MGDALSAVLNLKAQEAAQEQQRSDNLTQGLSMLNQARQQSIANNMAQLQLKAGLAEKGLIQDPTTLSGFKRDNSLQDPSANFLQGLKIQAEAKTANNPQAYLLGQKLTGSTPIDNVIQNNSTDMSQQKDVFGEYTPQAKLAQDAIKQTQAEIIKGPAEGNVGKISLANESLKNIEDIKKILFPDGTPKSFDRGAAFQGNTPHITVPFLGAVTPTYLTTEKGQDIFRKMGASISGRQLIQTGVAARPEETQKLIDQFAPHVASNPEATLKGLNELQSFYKDYLNNAIPEKRLGKNAPNQQEAAPFQIGETYNGEKIKSVKRIK